MTDYRELLTRPLQVPKPNTRGSEMKDYDKNYPELYNWGLIDSIHLSELGTKISQCIQFDLGTSERNFTPGLRYALNLIAEIADIERI